MSILAASNVSRIYRRGPERVHAVDDVSVAFAAGTLTLIVGPSGSGKTTLLNLLSGFERPDQGRVLWRGEETDPAALRWRDLAIIPQRLGILPELSVEENVALPGRLAGSEDTAEEVLAGLDLGGHLRAFPGELSMGQQQRVAVARAVAAEPTVLLADEPTSSQDEASARLVLETLLALASKGSACAIAGHDPLAREYADEVIAMRDGRIG